MIRFIEKIQKHQYRVEECNKQQPSKSMVSSLKTQVALKKLNASSTHEVKVGNLTIKKISKDSNKFGDPLNTSFE